MKRITTARNVQRILDEKLLSPDTEIKRDARRPTLDEFRDGAFEAESFRVLATISKIKNIQEVVHELEDLIDEDVRITQNSESSISRRYISVEVASEQENLRKVSSEAAKMLVDELGQDEKLTMSSSNTVRAPVIDAVKACDRNDIDIDELADKYGEVGLEERPTIIE